MIPPLKGFLPSTLIDWEGKISAEIFLPGCDFRCPYCHSWPLVLEPQKLADIPFETIVERLAGRRNWIDGIVISGGEPTLQEGLEHLLLELKRLGFGVKLDTNGSRPLVLRKLLKAKLLDAVSMDVKAPLDERYATVAGVDVDLEAIGQSIDQIRMSGIDYEFRTTVCPKFLDPPAVVEIARQLAGARRFVLQRFNPADCLDRQLKDSPTFSREELRRIAGQAAEFVEECWVRGDQPSPAQGTTIAVNSGGA